MCFIFHRLKVDYKDGDTTGTPWLRLTGSFLTGNYGGIEEESGLIRLRPFE